MAELGPPGAPLERSVSGVSASGTLGSTQFQDLKEILKRLEEGGELGDKPPPFQIQERVHALCRRFLGGSWKDVPVQDLLLHRMKSGKKPCTLGPEGGMSNMLFLCQLPPGYPPRKSEPDKTLLRVYFNPETESHLVAESVIFTLLSERALGPRLFGIFNGGRLEEFIVSRPLSCAEIRDPRVSQRIAKKLARVHNLSVPIEKDAEYLIDALERWLSHLVELVGGRLRPLVTKGPEGKDIELTAELLFDQLATVRFLDAVLSKREEDVLGIALPPKDSSVDTNSAVRVEVEGSAEVEAGEDAEALAAKSLDAKLRHPTAAHLDISMAELRSEMLLLKRCVKRSHAPVVFCHNDLQEGNILLPKGSGGFGGSGAAVDEEGEDSGLRKRSTSVYEKDLVLIDFEYASYNYRGFDFANHFCEMGIEYGTKAAPWFAMTPADFPNEEAQRVFFRSYREAEAELHGQAAEKLDQERVDKLVRETRPFVAVSHFFWGVWALLQLEVSPIEFGFEEYAKARLAGYFLWRPHLTALLDQDPPPRSPIPSRHTSGDKTRPPPPPIRIEQLQP